LSATVQTLPVAHPVCSTKGIGAFSCIKGPGCGVSHLLSSSAEVKERGDLYLYSHCAVMTGCRVTFMFRSGYVLFICLIFYDKCGSRRILLLSLDLAQKLRHFRGTNRESHRKYRDKESIIQDRTIKHHVSWNATRRHEAIKIKALYCIRRQDLGTA
jgi:hypothetical protein